MRAVKERSAVRSEVLVGSFLRHPTLVKASSDPTAAGASVIGDGEEMPHAKREVVVLVRERTVAASASCCTVWWPAGLERSALSSWTSFREPFAAIGTKVVPISLALSGF